jgi:hypothetical protein
VLDRLDSCGNHVSGPLARLECIDRQVERRRVIDGHARRSLDVNRRRFPTASPSHRDRHGGGCRRLVRRPAAPVKALGSSSSVSSKQSSPNDPKRAHHWWASRRRGRRKKKWNTMNLELRDAGRRRTLSCPRVTDG